MFKYPAVCVSPRTVKDTAATSTCFLMQELLGHGAYLPYVRDHVVQAQYFKVRTPRGAQRSLNGQEQDPKSIELGIV